MTSSATRRVVTQRQGIWYGLDDEVHQSLEIDDPLTQVDQMNSTNAIILSIAVPVILFAIIFFLLTLVAVFVIRHRRGWSGSTDTRFHVCFPIGYGPASPLQKSSEAATGDCPRAGVIPKKSCFSFSGSVAKTEATNERSSLLIDTQDELPVEESPRPPPRRNTQSSENNNVPMALAVSRLEPLHSVRQMPQRDYEELLDYLLSSNNSEASTTQPTAAPLVQTSQNTPPAGASRISRNTHPGLMQHFSNWHDIPTACSTCRCHLGHCSKALSVRSKRRRVEPPRQSRRNDGSPQYETLQRNPLGHDYDSVYVPRHDPIAMLRRVDNETGYIKNLQQSRGTTNSNNRRVQLPAENVTLHINEHSIIT